MTSTSRLPPLILFIQNTSIENVSEYLTDAGLRVAQTCNDVNTVATVLRMQPDLIVLDFSVNAETIERLKGDARTMSIPLIALVEAPPARERAGGAGPSPVALPRDRLAPETKI